jgi:hypothetical protein
MALARESHLGDPCKGSYRVVSVSNTFGTRASLSAKLRRGPSPNGFRSPSTPFAATAFPPTCRTTSPSRPPSLRVSKILRPPPLVLVLVVLVGV